jgi:hypothetical protein
MFQRKGMIPPRITNMAVTYDDANRLMKLGMSFWTIMYVRARKSGDPLKGFYRRNALMKNKEVEVKP